MMSCFYVFPLFSMTIEMKPLQTVDIFGSYMLAIVSVNKVMPSFVDKVIAL